jgi:chromosome partitioning protein
MGIALMTTLITIASLKGGVAKTTSAVALASALAQLEDVLLVDLDSQGQITLHFGLPLRSGVYHWLMGELPLLDCFYRGRPERLKILPGDSMTKALYARFQGTDGAQEIARRLRTFPTTFVVIDTASGLLQEAALLAADQVIIPFRCEAAGIDGLYASMEIVRQLNINAALTLLPVAYDMRLREHRDNLAHLAPTLKMEYGAEELYAIRARIAVAEAVAVGQSIWEYNAQGLGDVRIGYAYLAGRVLRLAGRDGTAFEHVEAIAHGNQR